MGRAILIVVVVLIAAVIGISFLPQPYYAIGQVVIYAGLVAAIAGKLRTCLRLSKGTDDYQKVNVVVVWVVLGVVSVVAHLADLFKTADRDYITLATNFAVYLALLYALELVSQLLERANVASAAAANDTSTTTALDVR